MATVLEIIVITAKEGIKEFQYVKKELLKG